MNRMQGNSSLKRKQPEGKSLSQKLSDGERDIYNLIRSKENMGIWARDIKRAINLPDNTVAKALKNLHAYKLIKEVTSKQNRGVKHYMAVEFEPSNELTGGAWYVDGKLDTGLITSLKVVCSGYINNLKVATAEVLVELVNKSGVLKEKCTVQQISEILQLLVWDNEVVEERSNETGEFASIPFGTLCYKSANKKVVRKVGAMASIPCGVCPRINDCTPDGIISPITCVYYAKWLEF